MVQRARFTKRNADQRLLGFFGGLADGFGHFACLAVTVADAALLVTNDHQCGEREAAATLDGSSDAVDGDQLFDELRRFFVTVAIAVFARTGHERFP